MGSSVPQAVLIGLGTAKAVEVTKRAVPWRLQPWTKLGLTALVSSGLALLTVNGWKNKLLAGLGGCGVASMAYELETAIRDFGDNQKTQLAARAGVRITPRNTG